ncbi:hypothetical protein MTO96_020294 [Rhipicephalus appendiculatus]
METNSAEAVCSGWIEVVSKKKLAERADSNAPTSAQGSGNGGSRTAAPQTVLRRVVPASRTPNLPRDHFKTIIRPRGGMDVKKTDLIIFKRALAKAASLTAEQVFDDTLCTNTNSDRVVRRTKGPPNTSCAMVFATLVPCIAGKWTSATRVVIWATWRTFAQRAKTRRNAAVVACRHHHRIINAIPSVPSVEERTERRTASAESASRCRTSCAKDGGAAGAHDIHSWRPDHAAPTQLGAKRQMRENKHSPPLTATDRHREDAPAPEDAAAADRALAPEGATVAEDAPVLQDDRVPRFESRNQ